MGIILFSHDDDVGIMEIVRVLSSEIGVRVGGSPEEARAAEFVANQFDACGLDVELQPFRFLGWQYVQDPVVKVLSPRREILEASPMSYTESTVDGPVVGSLKRVGTAYPVPGHRYFVFPKYAIIDESGVEKAYFLCHLGGKPMPFPNVLPMFTATCVMLGEEAHQRFEQWMAEGLEVMISVSVQGNYLPGSLSQNVVATLEGETDEIIVLGAHHDSAYGSPGANDNASGIAALCQLARNMTNTRLRRTVRFASFGSEEFKFIGSSFYVNDQKERGELNKIKAFIGLDTVGAGSPLGIRVSPEGLKSEVMRALKGSKLDQRIEAEFGPPLPASDDWPFHTEGIPSAMFTVLDFPEYHQPLDTEDLVECDLVLHVADVVHRLLRLVDETA